LHFEFKAKTKVKVIFSYTVLSVVISTS